MLEMDHVPLHSGKHGLEKVPGEVGQTGSAAVGRMARHVGTLSASSPSHSHNPNASVGGSSMPADLSTNFGGVITHSLVQAAAGDALKVCAGGGSGGILLDLRNLEKRQERIDNDKVRSLLTSSYMEIERLQTVVKSINIQLKDAEFKRRIVDESRRTDADNTMARNSSLEERIQVAVAEARQAKHALELREERCRRLTEENLRLQVSLRERLADGRRRLLEVQREVLNGHEQSMALTNAKREVEGRNEELQRTVEVLSEECHKYKLDVQTMKRMLQESNSIPRASLADQDLVAKEDKEALQRHLAFSKQQNEAISLELDLARAEVQVLRRDNVACELERAHLARSLTMVEKDLCCMHQDQSRISEERVMSWKACLLFRVKVADFALSSKKVSMRKALLFWLCAALRIRGLRDRVKWMAHGIRKRKLWSTFTSWFTHIREERLQLQIDSVGEDISRASGKIRVHVAYTTFRSWYAVVTHIQAVHSLVRARMWQLYHRTLVQVIDIWLVAVQGARTVRAKCAKVHRMLKRWVMSFCLTAIIVWQNRCKEQMAIKNKITKFVARKELNSAAACAIMTWRCHMQRYKRQKLVTVLLVRRRLLTAFERWRENFVVHRKKQEGLAKALQRLLNRSLKMTFEACSQNAAECKRQKIVLRRVMGRFIVQHISSIFVTWVGHVTEVRRQAFVIDQEVWRLMKQCLASSFRCWMDRVQEFKRQKAIVMRVSFRLFNSAVAGAFLRWKKCLYDLDRQQDVVRRLSIRMMIRAMMAAFATWNSSAGELKGTRMVIQKVVARFMQRALCITFSRWVNFFAEIKDQRALMARVTIRLFSSSLVRAFACWVDKLHEMQRIAGIMKKVILTMSVWSIVACFNAWKFTVEEVDRQAGLQLKIISKIMNYALQSALAIWLEHVTKCRVAKAALRKIVMREVTAAFATWQASTAKNGQMRVVLSKAFVRMLKASLANAFERWMEQVKELKQQGAFVRRVVIRMMQAGLLLCWNRWVEYRKAISKAQKCVSRLMLLRKEFVLDMWKGAVVEHKERFRQIACTWAKHDPEKAATLCNFRAFRCWSDVCWMLRADRMKGKKMTLIHGVFLSSSVIAAWMGEVLAARGACIEFRRASMTLLAKFFYAWKGSWMRMVHLSRGILRCSALWWRRFISKFVLLWLQAMERARQQERVCSALEKLPGEKRVILRMLVAWRAVCSLEESVRSARDALSHFERRTELLGSFSVWKMLKFAERGDKKDKVQAVYAMQLLEELDANSILARKQDIQREVSARIALFSWRSSVQGRAQSRIRLGILHTSVCRHLCKACVMMWHRMAVGWRHIKDFYSRKMRVKYLAFLLMWRSFVKHELWISTMLVHFVLRVRRHRCRCWFGFWRACKDAVSALTKLIARRVKLLEIRGLWAWRCSSKDVKGAVINAEFDELKVVARSWRGWRDGMSAQKEEAIALEFGKMLSDIFFVFGDSYLANFKEQKSGIKTVCELMGITRMYQQLAIKLRRKTTINLDLAPFVIIPGPVNPQSSLQILPLKDESSPLLNCASLPDSLASRYSASGCEHFRAQPLSKCADAWSITNSDFAINFVADDEMNLASFSEVSPIGSLRNSFTTGTDATLPNDRLQWL